MDPLSIAYYSVQELEQEFNEIEISEEEEIEFIECEILRFAD